MLKHCAHPTLHFFDSWWILGGVLDAKWKPYGIQEGPRGYKNVWIFKAFKHEAKRANDRTTSMVRLRFRGAPWMYLKSLQAV